MPDAITPVGTLIKPPDPAQGINTMTGILGLRQARQNLETGAYNQQTAQANAQMTQQDAQQRQAAGNFFRNFDIAKHHGDDGTLDLDSALTSPEFKATGDAAPEIAKSLLGIKNSQLAAKGALANLNGTLRDQFSSQVAGLAQDPDVKAGNQTGRGKVLDAIDQFGQVGGADAQRVAGIYGQVLQNTPPGKMSQALQNLQLQARSAGEQMGQAASVDTGPQIQPGANLPGGGFEAKGPPIKKDLGPAEQLGYVRARGAAGVEGSQGAQNDEALYNSIVQSGTKAAQIKSLSEDVRNLSKEVQTGQYSKAFADKWSALAQTFGYKPGDDSATTRRQILSKMAAQLKLQSEAGAPTDSARAGIEAAMPDPEHMDPAAVGQAARYVGAQSDVNAARAQFANRHRQVNGGASTGLRASDSSFMRDADPRIFEAQNVPAGPERQAYYKEHFKSKEEFQKFLDKQARMRSYGAIE